MLRQNLVNFLNSPHRSVNMDSTGETNKLGTTKPDLEEDTVSPTWVDHTIRSNWWKTERHSIDLSNHCIVASEKTPEM